MTGLAQGSGIRLVILQASVTGLALEGREGR